MSKECKCHCTCEQKSKRNVLKSFVLTFHERWPVDIDNAIYMKHMEESFRNRWGHVFPADILVREARHGE